MQRRVVVPALVAAVASAVAYALVRLRRPGGGNRRRGPEPPDYRCQCGQRFLVSGVGRHRVYWLPEASPGDPLLAAQCPRCERRLPREHEGAPAPVSSS
jgi:hypothetical protein